MKCVFNNHATLARLVLAGGQCSPNAVAPLVPPQNLLRIAAGFGWNEVLRVLLEAGADSNVCDDVGNTPLVNAMVHGHEETVRELIPHTNLRIYSADGLCALHNCIICNNSKCFKLLLPHYTTTSTCALSSHAPSFTWAIRTTPRHCSSPVRVVVTAW